MRQNVARIGRIFILMIFLLSLPACGTGGGGTGGSPPPSTSFSAPAGTNSTPTSFGKIAIDSKNDVWVTTNTGLMEIPAGATSCATTTDCPLFSLRFSPTGIAVDSKNNVWVTNDTSPGSVTEIPYGSTTYSCSNCTTFSGFSDPVAVTTTGTYPWVANSGTGSSYSPGVVEIVSSCPSGGCPSITHFTQPVGLAYDTSRNLWVIDAGNSTTAEITSSAIASATCSSSTPCYQYSLNAIPEGVATDSLGNVWISLKNAQVIEYKP